MRIFPTAGHFAELFCLGFGVFGLDFYSGGRTGFKLYVVEKIEQIFESCESRNGWKRTDFPRPMNRQEESPSGMLWSAGGYSAIRLLPVISAGCAKFMICSIVGAMSQSLPPSRSVHG